MREEGNTPAGLGKKESVLLTKLKKDTKREHICAHARKVFHRAFPKSVCEKCGWDKHTQVCHIKPVEGFSGEDTVGAINHISNLLGLCPNCHWEFDKRIWNISELDLSNRRNGVDSSETVHTPDLSGAV